MARVRSRFELQCGHGWASVENHQNNPGFLLDVEASMWPRLGVRGERRSPGLVRLQLLGFNVATAGRPWRTAHSAGHSPGPRRASMWPRLGVRGELGEQCSTQGDQESFNVATAGRPWRTTVRT